ncbi:type III pantothenate kinase [Capnocytophaga sp. HP1101]
MNLIIDEGNTLVKVALFEKGVQTFFLSIAKEDFQESFFKKVPLEGVMHCLIASVVRGAEERFSFLEELLPKVLYFTTETPVPFVNKYATPHSLGIDRLALVAGAVTRFPKRNVLIIDAGTCITFDIVTDRGEYLGGAIAPGIAMRLKAMHQFTSKLPLVSKQDFDVEQFIGNTTESCMLSGVYHNVVCEIEGVIEKYEAKFPSLITILTGGNQKYLQERIKNQIFAGSYVLLEGLNAILEYQIKE